MIALWEHTGPTILSAFLASLVECVEALTVVLAVGTVRGWRGALTGTGLALLLLALSVLILGPAVTAIPIEYLQLGIGVLLLLFGMRWFRKAILRAAGVISLHDEDAIYSEETRVLRAQASYPGTWDKVAITTAFKITMVEGIEVVFIVLAVGAASRTMLAAASTRRPCRPYGGDCCRFVAATAGHNDPGEHAEIRGWRAAMCVRHVLGWRRPGA